MTSAPTGTDVHVRAMTVGQVHQWARRIPGLPRSDADAFSGQCFLEDIDGVALLAQTRETLCRELGVAPHHVHFVEAAIQTCRQEGTGPNPSDVDELIRSSSDSLHGVTVSEGVPPSSPATALRVSAMRSPVDTSDLVRQVEDSLSALQDRHDGVVELGKRVSRQAFQSAEEGRAASVAAEEAVHRDLEARFAEHFEERQAIEQRAAATVREAWEARHESLTMLAIAEDEHTAREAELVARIDELTKRVATEAEARIAAERRRDEVENELALAQAMGEGAVEQLDLELRRACEERAAMKIQMTWRVYRVTKVALTEPLSHRALLLEVESARVAAAVKNAQIQAHELQTQLARQEQQLASEARMREAMHRYANQRLAMKNQALPRPPISSAAAVRDLVSSGYIEEVAKRTPTSSPTAAAASVLSSPVTPVAECEVVSHTELKERRGMQAQQHRQQPVALDEV